MYCQPCLPFKYTHAHLASLSLCPRRKLTLEEPTHSAETQRTGYRSARQELSKACGRWLPQSSDGNPGRRISLHLLPPMGELQLFKTDLTEELNPTSKPSPSQPSSSKLSSFPARAQALFTRKKAFCQVLTNQMQTISILKNVRNFRGVGPRSNKQTEKHNLRKPSMVSAYYPGSLCSRDS